MASAHCTAYRWHSFRRDRLWLPRMDGLLLVRHGACASNGNLAVPVAGGRGVLLHSVGAAGLDWLPGNGHSRCAYVLLHAAAQYGAGVPVRSFA
ncbi:hypothetical protein D3C84_1101040 [compost metagenome]